MPFGLHSVYARPEIAVRCPNCGKEAVFVDPYFFFLDDSMKTGGHLPRIKTDLGFAVVRFPRVFSWSAADSGLSNMIPRLGVLSCCSCPCRRKHKLNWPKDAFYQVEICNSILWGWSREHFVSIRDFIASKERNLSKHYEHRRIPAEFLNVNRRKAIVQAIDRLLETT